MAVHNQNYKVVNLTSGGTYDAGFCGDNVTATTIHEIFCLESGVININALGGGSFSWSATTSQSINVLVKSCNVTSGNFIGFKSQTSWIPYRG